jgi:hypothetical protein
VQYPSPSSQINHITSWKIWVAYSALTVGWAFFHYFVFYKFYYEDPDHADPFRIPDAIATACTLVGEEKFVIGY